MSPDQEQLIEENLPLVIKLARVYEGRGIPFLDLIQVGNLALVEAAARFSAGTSLHFPPLAAYHIRRAMNKLFTELEDK